jgi:hypothetical protein
VAGGAEAVVVGLGLLSAEGWQAQRAAEAPRSQKGLWRAGGLTITSLQGRPRAAGG